MRDSSSRMEVYQLTWPSVKAMMPPSSLNTPSVASQDPLGLRPRDHTSGVPEGALGSVRLATSQERGYSLNSGLSCEEVPTRFITEIGMGAPSAAFSATATSKSSIHIVGSFISPYLASFSAQP